MKYSFTENRGLYAFVLVFALFGLMITSLYLSLEFVKLTLPLLFGISDATAFISSPERLIAYPSATIYFEAVTSPIGVFIVPTLFYYIVFRFDLIGETGLRIIPAGRYWLTALFIILLAAVFIQLLVQINTAIPLPASMQQFRTPQAQVDRMLDSFFKDTGFIHFLVLTLCIALLPAIGEELCFRGTIQNILSRSGLGSLGAIILTGFIFSIFHAEFNNFLAIWCMGIVLGLLYYYSGSLWVSIAAHFTFNFIMILGRYLYGIGVIKSDITGSDALPLYFTVPAGIVMIGALVTMSRWSSRKVSMLG